MNPVITKVKIQVASPEATPYRWKDSTVAWFCITVLSLIAIYVL